MGRDAAAVAQGRRLLLTAVVATFALSGAFVWTLLERQPAGVDFSPLWAGARTALTDPARLYDFRHITDLQGWPLGPEKLRPFVYPPTLLLVLAPFAALPLFAAYVAWILTTGALFLAVGLKARAPWWFVTFAPVMLVAYAGQVTFLVGALMLAALTLKDRPWLAGVLWGLAACVKPQLLIFAPLALLAEGRWKTLIAAGGAGLLLIAVSAAIFGVETWLRWPAAIGAFQHLVFSDPDLSGDASTPYATLALFGLPGWWAYPLAAPLAWLVWTVFRRTEDVWARLAAVAGAGLLAGPYALAYDRAALAPAVAAGLVATLHDRRWFLSVLAAALYSVIAPLAFIAVLSAMTMPWLSAKARAHSAA